MSIFPPTDIVTEVAQAADPQKLHVAMARLAAANSVRPNEQFSTLVNGASFQQNPHRSVTSAANALGGGASSLASASVDRQASDAARKFEAYVIQSFLQTILPQEEHGFFGSGTAGGIWRSMIAEQLGNQIAKAGGIGLHKMLERHWTQQGVHAQAGPPSS